MMHDIAPYRSEDFCAFTIIGGLIAAFVSTVTGIGLAFDPGFSVAIWFFIPLVLWVINTFLVYTHIDGSITKRAREALIVYRKLPKEVKEMMGNPSYKITTKMNDQQAIAWKEKMITLQDDWNENQSLSKNSDPSVLALLEKTDDSIKHLEIHTKTMKELA